MSKSQSSSGDTERAHAFLGGLVLLGWTGYLLLMALSILFVHLNPAPATFGGRLFSLSQILSYPLMYLAPSLLFLLLAGVLGAGRGLARWMAGGALFLGWLVFLLLLGDLILFLRFGFHVNGMVANLLLTPGGFTSMGLDAATLGPAVLAILLSGAVVFGFGCFLLSRKRLALRGWLVRATWISVPLLLLLFCGGLFATGLASFYNQQSVLARLNAFPISPRIRMRRFLLRLGCQEPPREARLVLGKRASGGGSYPAAAIVRREGRRPNIIWLVAESFRADVLSAEIMPNLFGYAKDSCRFLRHYSGGHGTRPGMFSMFYGLHAFSWDAFLDKRRPPVLFDWLHEDGYQMLCQTSSDFSYPEFNKTVFSSVPAEAIRERQKGFPPWQNDEQNISRLLAFMKDRDAGRPFFAFCFFESTHAPYHFPEAQPLYPDYQKSINYSTVSARDAKALFCRYANAAHYLDSQLGRLLAALKEDAALGENTVVIVTGDHGEEFFEKGRLGHNSTFSEEQIHVPLVLHVPGRTPRVVEALTSHLDLPATLASLLGVENPPGDYSLGRDLLAEDYHREMTVVCGWDTAAAMDGECKAAIPMGLYSAWTEDRVTRLDDSPCTEEEERKFLAGFPAMLMRVQREAARFKP